MYDLFVVKILSLAFNVHRYNIVQSRIRATYALYQRFSIGNVGYRKLFILLLHDNKTIKILTLESNTITFFFFNEKWNEWLNHNQKILFKKKYHFESTKGIYSIHFCYRLNTTLDLKKRKENERTERVRYHNSNVLTKNSRLATRRGNNSGYHGEE